MTRQDTVIKIAKITKIIGEWKFRYDLDGEVEMETLSPELLDIATWIRDIQQYIESDSSPVLVRLIMNIGFTDMLDDYIHEHKIGQLSFPRCAGDAFRTPHHENS